jgi:hypothetical protein
LTTVGGDEKVRLVNESTPYVQGVERPQGMTFDAAKGLVKSLLREVAKIGLR